MRHKDTLTEKHVQKDSQIYAHVHTTEGKQRPFLSHHIPVSPSGTEMQLQIAEDATKWNLLHIIDIAAYANIDWS